MNHAIWRPAGESGSSVAIRRSSPLCCAAAGAGAAAATSRRAATASSAASARGRSRDWAASCGHVDSSGGQAVAAAKSRQGQRREPERGRGRIGRVAELRALRVAVGLGLPLHDETPPVEVEHPVLLDARARVQLALDPRSRWSDETATSTISVAVAGW